MDFAVHRYRSACGGLELAARLYPGPTDAAPALLMMHGLTRNSADFEPLAAHLAGQYRLVVPDQRGRGLSQWDPEPANYRPDVYAGDMFALLDGLGIVRSTWIGTSMGGLMALVMNAMRPEAASAVVFNDVGPVLDPAGLARIGGYVGPSGPMTSWDEAAARCRAINAEAFPDFGKRDWLAFAERTCIEREDGLIDFAYDPAIASGFEDSETGDAIVPPDLWPLWDMLDAKPVMAIRGALSDLLSAATVVEMGERHSGPFATVEVPRRGHAPLLDEPEVIAALLPFLAEYAG
ncbi:alpha/beta hydrolase [Novosphingobium sp. PC22D]|uniref:alpha/beta fold hydrolase n=1 Tax=Novosphingobium sp. PC22D TaxID=1962403 RepID=UPI000BF07EE7|nr:alpha/beta hydrolase [Novosphingobium sp. PC22D]PEQ13816.1 alpha/beta hydrolase [Novosphingobium sp. PC22D]